MKVRKTALIALALVLFSCEKEKSVQEQSVATDSIAPAVGGPRSDADSTKMKDSIVNNAPATKEVLRSGVMRDVSGKQIVREADASQLPFRIGEEFTDETQEFVLKLKNFQKGKITAAVKPSNPVMNIRIKQIRLPDGTFDGPFSQEIEGYEILESGEIWLVIGHNQMAEGKMTGSFTVSVE